MHKDLRGDTDQPGRAYPTKDHIFPKLWGGANAAENYRIVCRRCNSLRAAMGHCVGAMACLRAIADDKKIKPWLVFNQIKRRKLWIEAFKILKSNLEAMGIN